VKEIEDGIKYYVEENQNPDFMEDDTIYDDLNLQEEEAIYGMGADLDRISSNDDQSVQDETPDLEGKPPAPKPKAPEPAQSGARRPSTQLKSPLPALATLHTPIPGASSSAAPTMKPAPLPTRIPGETPLKYASAAAAAAASDKNGVGIAPLPPPPGAAAAQSGLASAGARASASNSPAPAHLKLAQASGEPAQPAQTSRSPAAAPSIPATPAHVQLRRKMPTSQAGEHRRPTA
jgi:CCR4-NOT transcription complex subunit 3